MGEVDRLKMCQVPLNQFPAFCDESLEIGAHGCTCILNAIVRCFIDSALKVVRHDRPFGPKAFIFSYLRVQTKPPASPQKAALP